MSFKADVSIVNWPFVRASGGIVGCVCVYTLKTEVNYWRKHSNERNKNKFAEWKAFVDTVGIKSTDLKEIFVQEFCNFSELPRCKERQQTAPCC